MSNVIVLGTLGDLVKKIVELEMLERTPSRDTTVQMAAYYSILDQWPVEDKDIVTSLVQSFRVQAAKHIAIESSMLEQCKKVAEVKFVGSTSTAYILFTIVQRYTVSKKQLRAILEQLNSQGKHFGLPPLAMELADGKESSTDEQPCNNAQGDSTGN